MKLHKLKISSKTFETKDAVSLEFQIPEELKDTFQYNPGQFLAMQFNINGENYRREYSICSSPYLSEPLTIAAKKVPGGIVSNYICDTLKEGDTVEVYPPQGKFSPDIKPRRENCYMLIGGGSGITPLISIIKSVLAAEPGSRIVLYYGSRNEDGIIFRKKLEELEEAHKERFKNYFTLEEPHGGWKGLSGLIDKETLISIADENFGEEKFCTEYFICGPSAMMELAKNALADANIPEGWIHIEYFELPAANIKEAIVENEEGKIEIEEIELKPREVKIILEGEEHNVTVLPEQSVLDAAFDAGLDPPYSCRSGICTTCRAKLHTGKVKMDEREGLSDSEIEEGYILTCQSHPLTDDTVIEYD
jgi:ring-1,2-phenylacetyl-CoA epoxidase subunit PaaE